MTNKMKVTSVHVSHSLLITIFVVSITNGFLCLSLFFMLQKQEHGYRHIIWTQNAEANAVIGVLRVFSGLIFVWFCGFSNMYGHSLRLLCSTFIERL